MQEIKREGQLHIISFMQDGGATRPELPSEKKQPAPKKKPVNYGEIAFKIYIAITLLLCYPIVGSVWVKPIVAKYPGLKGVNPDDDLTVAVFLTGLMIYSLLWIIPYLVRKYILAK